MSRAEKLLNEMKMVEKKLKDKDFRNPRDAVEMDDFQKFAKDKLKDKPEDLIRKGFFEKTKDGEIIPSKKLAKEMASTGNSFDEKEIDGLTDQLESMIRDVANSVIKKVAKKRNVKPKGIEAEVKLNVDPNSFQSPAKVEIYYKGEEEEVEIGFGAPPSMDFDAKVDEFEDMEWTLLLDFESPWHESDVRDNWEQVELLRTLNELGVDDDSEEKLKKAVNELIDSAEE